MHTSPIHNPQRRFRSIHLHCTALRGGGGGNGAIPIYDLDFHNDGSHNDEDYHWMPSEYTWSSVALGEVMDHEAEKVSGLSWGYGSLPNCHFWMINVEESKCDFDAVGITPQTYEC